MKKYNALMLAVFVTASLPCYADNAEQLAVLDAQIREIQRGGGTVPKELLQVSDALKKEEAKDASASVLPNVLSASVTSDDKLDPQISTIVRAAESYYAVYLETVRLGRSASDQAKAYDAHKKTAELANKTYQSLKR